MSFQSLLIHTVTIRNLVEGAEDRYGDAEQTYDAGSTFKARVDMLAVGGQGRELYINRDTRQTYFTVFLPAGVNINGLSIIDWEGRALHVEGEPSHIFDSIGEHHIEATCKEVLD